MKDYFLEIVKDGVRIDVAHTKANTQEEANTVITKAAIGRGMENFSVREVTQEEFDAFRAKQKPDDDKQAEADAKAAEEQAQRDAEALAAKEAEGNADSAQSDDAGNTGEATQPAEGEGTEEKPAAEGTDTAAAA
jgi:membrane protein involved in colicin uptake